MANITPYFGSLDMSNFFSQFGESNTRRFSETRIPQRNGSIVQQPTIGQKVVTLTGRIFGTDADNARSAINSISGELFSKGVDVLRLFDDRYLEARAETFDVDVNGSDGMTGVRATARFRADAIPFWQSDTAVNTTQNVSSGDQLAFVNSGTANTPLAFTITNGTGSGITPIYITLQNSARWTYSGTLANSSVLVVDTRSYYVAVDGAPAAGDFSGSYFTLVPGSNTLTYVGDTVQLQVVFNPWWYNY